eukprot:1281140-Ditylum_brightwellii.AAC.1
MKIRRTGTQTDAPSPKDVRLSMKSDDESSSSDSDQSDTTLPTQNGKKAKRSRKRVKTNKVVRSSRPSQGSSEKGFDFHTILDSGTEWTVIGGPAWSVVKHYDKKLSMSAVDTAMSDVSMQCCDAVTAVLTRNGQIQLFGIRRGCYSPALTDNEAVVNSHFIRKAGWPVDCVATRHGGSQ